MADNTKTKKRDKSLTIQKISDAALEIFSGYSYESASTKKIAEKAGVNSALIFNYFGNKQGLFNYVFNSAKIRNSQFAPSYEFQTTPTDELKTFTSSYIDEILAKRSILRSILFLRNYQDSYELDGMYNARSTVLTERLKEYQKLGDISKSINLRAFAESFIHMVDGIVLTFSVYSNETKQYLTDKLFPLIEVITVGLKYNKEPIGAISGRRI